MTFQNNFVPASKTITAITRANPGVVTTASNHGYHDGLYVRLVWLGNFGMNQLNGRVFLITVLSPTTFSIGVDTRSYDAFVISSTSQVPQVIPMAEISSTLVNAEINNENIIPET